MASKPMLWNKARRPHSGTMRLVWQMFRPTTIARWNLAYETVSKTRRGRIHQNPTPVASTHFKRVDAGMTVGVIDFPGEAMASAGSR
jgi:hypothetical protein